MTEFIQQRGLVNVSSGEIYNSCVSASPELQSQQCAHLTGDLIYAQPRSDTRSSQMTVQEGLVLLSS